MPAQSLSKLLPGFMLNLAGVDDRIKYKLESRTIASGRGSSKKECLRAGKSVVAALRSANDPLQLTFAQFSCQLYRRQRTETGLRVKDRFALFFHFPKPLFYTIQ